MTVTDFTVTGAHRRVLATITETRSLTPLGIKRSMIGNTPVATIRDLLGDLIEAGYVVAVSGEEHGNTTAYRIADGITCPGECRHLLNPVQARNALSRFDNETYVCSSCGTNESMVSINGGTLTGPGKITY